VSTPLPEDTAAADAGLDAAGSKALHLSHHDTIHATINSLTAVATSGLYGDLEGAPVIQAADTSITVDNTTPGVVALSANTPGSISSDWFVRYVVRENPDGTYPAAPNVLKEVCGRNTPVPRSDFILGDYDIWTQGGTAQVPVAGVAATGLPVAPVSTTTWSWTLPTGMTVGRMFTMAVLTHTQAANTYTLTVGTGGTARVIGEAVPTLIASGFAMRIYSFLVDANTSGATVTMTVATALVNAVRMIAYGRSYGGLNVTTTTANGVETIVPHNSSKSTVSTASVKPTPALDVTATCLALTFVGGAASAAPAIASWTIPAPYTVQAQAYYTGATAYLSGAMATDLLVTNPGTIPARNWSSFDSTGAAASSLAGAYTLAYPLTRSATARYQWDAGSWHLLMQAA